MKKKKESLTKSKDRVKKLGEVFTPAALVSEMLDKLPADCWLPHKTFLEPSCGNGNFLVAILERKLDMGHPPLQALATIYGVDIMEDNIVESRARMEKVLRQRELDEATLSEGVEIIAKNIKRGNTLEQKLEDIFL
jgi:SAM-dependent methyltransferase